MLLIFVDMATVEIVTVLTLDDGTVVKNNGKVEIDDEQVSQLITIEYASYSDGGPLMRPNNPPTW